MSSMVAKKGDNTEIFSISVGGVSDYTNYRGELAILDPSDGTFVLTKTVIATLPSGGFSIGFSPAQTAALAVGDYNVVFEIIKEVATVVEFRRELSWPLKITPSLINN
jgi:hypothetical protein